MSNANEPTVFPGLVERGLTKREYFAAKALQGLLANPGGPLRANPINGWNYANCDIRDVAVEAIRAADAVLAELAKSVMP